MTDQLLQNIIRLDVMTRIGNRCHVGIVISEIGSLDLPCKNFLVWIPNFKKVQALPCRMLILTPDQGVMREGVVVLRSAFPAYSSNALIDEIVDYHIKR